jgi:(p)ppGpp synthase/HD superfamily hydrolase
MGEDATYAYPSFVAGDPLLEGAFRFARSAHHGPRSADETHIAHPVAVAQLLHREGFAAPVVAAALLHDVVEDTHTDVAEIKGRFGPEVAQLVEAMTENPEIPSYAERKGEHRQRVARDRRVAAIYAADKVANTRGIRDEAAAPAEKVEHYRRTLQELCRQHPDLPFLDELRFELERLQEA